MRPSGRVRHRRTAGPDQGAHIPGQGPRCYQIIIAINKMDATKPAYDEKTYNEVKEAGRSASEEHRLQGGRRSPSSRSPHTRGTTSNKAIARNAVVQGPNPARGPQQAEGPANPGNLPLRLPIQDVYTITGIGTVPVGRVETRHPEAGHEDHLHAVQQGRRSEEHRDAPRAADRRQCPATTSASTSVASPRTTSRGEMLPARSTTRRPSPRRSPPRSWS